MLPLFPTNACSKRRRLAERCAAGGMFKTVRVAGEKMANKDSAMRYIVFALLFAAALLAVPAARQQIARLGVAPPVSTTAQSASDPPVASRPYGATSIWNTPVSAQPRFLPNSAALVAAQFPGGRNPDGMRGTEAGRYDYSHPIYSAVASDPVISLACTRYCAAKYPRSMHIPANARVAGGTDAHIAVVQPDGTEIDAWAAYGAPGTKLAEDALHNAQTRDWRSGDTLTAGNVSNCGSYRNGPGLASPPGSTAANFCLGAGIVTAAELIAGRIDHALFLTGGCAIGSQYPATGNTRQCTSGQLGPPLGGRVWYDVPCATTRANHALKPWEVSVLCALNVYGGYFGDASGGAASYTGGILPQIASEEPWHDRNGAAYTSPLAPLAAQGWNSITIRDANDGSSGTRWVYDNQSPWNPPGVNFLAHIHWLDPCSAEKRC